MVISQVNPAQTAVGNNAQNFVLTCHDIAGRKLRRGNLLLCGVDERRRRVARHDERQARHAVGHLAVGALGRTPLAESIDGRAPRALRGILLLAAVTQLPQLRNQGADIIRVVEVAVRIRAVLVREGVEGHG